MYTAEDIPPIHRGKQAAHSIIGISFPLSLHSLLAIALVGPFSALPRLTRTSRVLLFLNLCPFDLLLLFRS